MGQVLSREEAAQRMASLENWQLENSVIKKEIKFKEFMDSIAFVDRVATLVEMADHHPDILIRYNRVQLTLSTHSAGGLTEKDFQLAAEIDRLKI